MYPVIREKNKFIWVTKLGISPLFSGLNKKILPPIEMSEKKQSVALIPRSNIWCQSYILHLSIWALEPERNENQDICGLFIKV